MKFTKQLLNSVSCDEFNLSLDVHPATADHPFNRGEKLSNSSGERVPLITDQCCIRFDGVMVGYVMSNLTISLIVPESQLTEPVVSAIKEMVSQLGDVPKVNAVPDRIETPDEVDE